MCFSFVANAQRGVRIGYIDMEYILENVPEYKEASTQLNGKVQRWKKDLEKKKEHLEKEIEDFKKKIVQNEKEIKENIDLQAKKKEAIQIQDKKVKKVEQKLKELN